MQSIDNSKKFITLRVLENYLNKNIDKYISTYINKDSSNYTESDKLNLIERIIHVEDAIKSQNEKINLLIHQIDKRFEQVDKRFEQVDKRFEQVDKRFEQIDKRFNTLQWFIGGGFTLIVVLMSIYEFIR